MSEEVRITLPDTGAATSSAQAVLANAKAMEITDTVMYDLAGTELREIRTKKKRLEEQRLSITRPMDEAKKRVMDLFRPPLAALDQADEVLSSMMVTFANEQERIAAQARQAAEAAAAKERERLAEAARKLEEEARQKAEAAKAITGETRQQAELEAAAIESQARETAAQATMVVAAEPVVTAPVSAGAGAVKTWKAEVVSLKDLIQWVAANPSFTHLLKADESALNQLAKSMKENFNVGGVRATQTTSMRSSR